MDLAVCVLRGRACFTSSTAACAPAAAPPAAAAAAARPVPARTRGAAEGRRCTEADPGRTGATPPGPGLSVCQTASLPAPGSGWRCGGAVAAEARPGSAPRGPASSCSGGSGTRSSPGSG